MARMWGWLAALAVWSSGWCSAFEPVDLRAIATDLTVPPLTDEAPGAGRRVRQKGAGYEATDVYHTLYLPTDWQAGRSYPVIVEYPGNGPYRNALGDVSSGLVDDCLLGYGASGGRGCLWVCLPFIHADGKQNQRQWWGDPQATVRYCQAIVDEVCRKYGGDRRRLILAGFSRGAIACNYIGLYDDQIARLWSGFICHSHYDGVRSWGYAGDDRAAAATRLKRLAGRPQWISHETSTAETRRYLEAAAPGGAFTFYDLPFPNHSAGWVLRDLPARNALRKWLDETTRNSER